MNSIPLDWIMEIYLNQILPMIVRAMVWLNGLIVAIKNNYMNLKKLLGHFLETMTLELEKEELK